ncbi:unnamed protein product [Ectocarpus sp. 8 AP-2014]
MVLVSWAALACCSSAIAGLGKADSGMLVIEDRTEAIAKDVLEIIDLPADTAVGLGLVSDSYDVLEASVGDCENPDIAQAIVAGLDFGSLASEVQTAINEIDRTSLADIAKQVQGISDAVYTTKVLRRTIVWPTIILALVFVALFILISCTTYEAVACARPSCRAPCTGGFAPFVVFLAVVVYLCAASVISLSALTGDYCIDPNGNTERLLASAIEDEGIVDIVTWYTTDCQSKESVPFDAVILAQEFARVFIQLTLTSLYDTSTNVCEELLPFTRSLETSFQALWTTLEEAAELTSCENINGFYQRVVFEEICDDVPEGLLNYWVSCCLLAVLLLVLVVQWKYLIESKSADKDAEVVEANDGSGLIGSPNSQPPGDPAGGLPARSY